MELDNTSVANFVDSPWLLPAIDTFGAQVDGCIKEACITQSAFSITTHNYLQYRERMIPLAIPVMATALSLLVAFLYFARDSTRNIRNRLPPGKASIPLIGDTFSFFRPQPVTTLGGYIEHRLSRFGKIFLSNLMGGPTVISADADVNQFVLKNDMKAFESRWPSAFKKLMASTDETSRMLVRSNLFEFLTAKRLRSLFLEDVDQHASHLLSSWKEGAVISAKLEASKFFSYLAVKRLLSMTPDDSETEKLSREYNSFMQGLCSLPLAIPGTAFWRALQSRKYILSFFMGEVEERMAKRGDSSTTGVEREDFLGCLLKANYNFSKEKIGDLLLGVLFASHDTISRATSLSIYFLRGCPKAIEQLREEHMEVVRSKKEGDTKLTWDDYKTMEFTKCVINETLRLGSISGFAQRTATKDVEINDYVLPRGFNVLLHFQAVHMDPDIYEEPEQFNPWRWMSSTGTKMTKNFTAFGGGEHYCPGAETARLDMAVFLHHLVLRYDWELAEAECPLRTPFIEFPKGLPIKIIAHHRK